VVLVGLSLSVVLIQPAVAARGKRSLPTQAQAPTGRETRMAEAQKAVAGLIEKSSVRPVEAKVIAAEAKRIVQSLNEEQITRLLAGESLAAVLPASRSTAKIAGGPVATAASTPTLGDSQSDLVFVPVPPCRIIDTRLAGGVIGPGTTRAFVVTGTAGFTAQGGNSGGCGIPQGASTPLAAAVSINFVAVGPQGPGDMSAWPYGQTRPNSSIINYANVGGLNIANGLVVPIAGVSTQPDDLNVQAHVSGAYLVADVTGYFTRFPVEQFQGTLKSTVTESDDSTLRDLDGTCKVVNSCIITAPADGKVVVSAWVGVVADHTQGTEDKVAFGFETASTPTCGWTVDSVDTSVATASAGFGTNSDYDMTLSHGATFPLAAGVTQTYSLSIRWLAGASSGDQYENSRMICTFIPN
jgi:hypothetical protein